MGEEDKLQQECFDWFWNNYPILRGMLFSVPNGGFRRGLDSKILKVTGLVSGVSDLILLNNGNVELLEAKTESGSQSKNQKDWQERVEFFNFNYTIFRNLRQFINIIELSVDFKYRKKKSETFNEYQERFNLKVKIKR